MFKRGRLDHFVLNAASEEAFGELRRRLVAEGASDGIVKDLGSLLLLRFHRFGRRRARSCLGKTPSSRRTEPEARPVHHGRDGLIAPTRRKRHFTRRTQVDTRISKVPSAAPGTRVALVTGRTDGIGRAVALQLARGGDRVLFVGRNRERGTEVLAALREARPGADHVFLPGDLSMLSETARVADEVAPQRR